MKTDTLNHSALARRYGQLQTDFPGGYSCKSHISSLKLLNLNNAPDAWETDFRSLNVKTRERKIDEPKFCEEVMRHELTTCLVVDGPVLILMILKRPKVSATTG